MTINFVIAAFILVLYGVHATEFDVIPGGQRWEMKETLKDVTCIFTYICQGGTKEKWNIEINEKDGACKIVRGDGKSYLFFQEFQVEVQGALIEDAMIFKNGPKEADVKQFTVDRKNNKVMHSNQFGNELSGLDVRFSKKREDL